MPVNCSSFNRCRSVQCNACRWRYSGRIARRAVSNGRRFYTIEIDLELGRENFRRWASRVRNVVEYRRARARWWDEVSLTVWLCRDQRARGIVALGSIQEAEFIKGFERWPTKIRTIPPEDVRAEIYQLLHVDKLAAVPNARRYQSINFGIGPRKLKSMGPMPHGEAVSVPFEIEAMPCLF